MSRFLRSCFFVSLPCLLACGDSFTLTLDLQSHHEDATFTVDGEAASCAGANPCSHQIHHPDAEEAAAEIEATPVVVGCWQDAKTCGYFIVDMISCASSPWLGTLLEERIALTFDQDDQAWISEVECIGDKDRELWIP